MTFVEAVNARPAFEQRLDLKAGAHDQPARALWAVQAFMAGEAHDIGARFNNIERPGAGRLSSVKHEQRPCFVSHARHARDIVYVARNVGRMRGRHKRCPFE